MPGTRFPAESEGQGTRTKAVSRRVLQHIAQGRCTKVESIFLLYYFSRRISQAVPKSRLQTGERYARFKFDELEESPMLPLAHQT